MGMMPTIRETFERVINEKLTNPAITAAEIKDLACAYAQLSNYDYLANLSSGFQGSSYLNAPYEST